MNVEGACDFADGGSFLQQSLGERQLLLVHLLRASEANTALLGVGATGTGAFADKVALEFSDAGKDGHNHLAGVRSGIGPRFGDGLETGTGLADRFDYLKQVTGGARQPVELPDGDDISVAELV